MGNDYFCHKEEYQEKLDKQEYRDYEKEKYPDDDVGDGRNEPDTLQGTRGKRIH